jgi:hypothetical protein
MLVMGQIVIFPLALLLAVAVLVTMVILPVVAALLAVLAVEQVYLIRLEDFLAAPVQQDRVIMVEVPPAELLVPGAVAVVQVLPEQVGVALEKVAMALLG